jgi:hypothetical protein
MCVEDQVRRRDGKSGERTDTERECVCVRACEKRRYQNISIIEERKASKKQKKKEMETRCRKAKTEEVEQEDERIRTVKHTHAHTGEHTSIRARR